MTAVVLVGVPGAGKSTVGKALAERLGEPFTDIDELVEQRAGKAISQIFIDDGEPAFRALEAAAIADVLSESCGVVALGGGALGNEDTRARVAGHTVVWLKANLATAVDRVGLNQNRPLLLGNVRGQLSDLMSKREPIYEAAATVSVDTSALTVEQVVDAVAEQLGSRT